MVVSMTYLTVYVLQTSLFSVQSLYGHVSSYGKRVLQCKRQLQNQCHELSSDCYFLNISSSSLFSFLRLKPNYRL